MALPPALCDREQEKFQEDSSGDVAVNVVGEFGVTGLGDTFRVTTLDITDTAALLPASALNNRNSLTVHNTSTTDTLYVGETSGVTADRVIGTTSGHEVGPSQFFNLDLTDSRVLYGIAETGKTIRVKVTELS